MDEFEEWWQDNEAEHWNGGDEGTAHNGAFHAWNYQQKELDAQLTTYQLKIKELYNLEIKLKEAEKVIAFYANVEHWDTLGDALRMSMDEDKAGVVDHKDCDESVHFATLFYGGKMAREYFQNKS